MAYSIEGPSAAGNVYEVPPQPKLAEPLCLNLTLYTAQASLKEFEYVDGPRYTVCMTALACC